MNKLRLVVAIAAGLLAVLSAQQHSYAQYVDGGVPGLSEETLQKCADLGIERTQCSDASVLLKERVGMVEGEGSGTAFIAKEAGQMVALIGVLGGIFGSVAGAFFVMGRRKKQVLESA